MQTTIPAFLLAALLGACGSDGRSGARRGARPVTVLRLGVSDPSRDATLTGSVEPYRQEKLAFEVGGRVDLIVGVGTQVERGFTDAEGRPLDFRGDVIARLDPTRYELQVKALQAKIAATRKDLEAQDIEVRQVATAELEAARKEVNAAQAALTLARTTRDDAERLLRGGAGTKQDVDRARNDYEQALARRQQADTTLAAREATIELKQAQLEATRARIEELESTLAKARRDLSDCTLHAPFAGRVTELQVARGAIVAAGTPVATLTMMDPIRISVAVSADMDRRLRLYEQAQFEIPDAIDPRKRIRLSGVVIDKGEVADPATRTFRIDLIVRNSALLLVPDKPELKGVPVLEEVLPAVTRRLGDPSEIFVEARTIARDEEGYYVLEMDGPRMGSLEHAVRFRVVPVKKVRIVPDDAHWSVARWKFRRLKDAGGLRDGVPLVVIPRDDDGKPIPDPDQRFGNGVVVGSRSWLLRPGELVPVTFQVERLPPGFYVPMPAIRELNGVTFVFVVRDGFAHRVAVTVHETFRELSRIEGGGLEEGAALVLDGVHYLLDGDPVNVLREEGS